MPGLIVIGYDGSEEARRAIEAARSLDAQHALVVHVWLATMPAGEATLPLGASPPPLLGQREELEEAARHTAQEGVARAADAGFSADPVTVEADSTGQIGRALAQVAAERGATAIVVGRRGVSRLEAALVGSTSLGVVRAAGCPVLVVPAPDEYSASSSAVAPRAG